ncbi:5-oxoprolinase subunit B family protein [Microbacterium hatanonis]|uniref:Allophanate hydrolase subunit 1 n=1 Tax=Microbacterium hatanonis TaxID=404366 RepID=A0A5C8HY22_9MICO|nr:allophanate hydrolase subunit 1 [Microbacterium hatanonis]TXK10172.1 allophanate hydrolase subunit 1 [Microbacterium hatanonis]
MRGDAAASVIVRPMGDRALLAEVGSLDAVLALHAALDASRPPGVVDLVPAARTVLIALDPAVLPLSRARGWIADAAEHAGPDAAEPGPLVEIEVRYDGPDLADTAELLGLAPRALVERHLATAWSVAFTGFAPGFAYLVGEGWPFEVPRLSAPRTRVPAGAVGLAGSFCGAYPRETPGGWRLIGTTRAALFDAGADDPVLLAPRSRVRFVEATA